MVMSKANEKDMKRVTECFGEKTFDECFGVYRWNDWSPSRYDSENNCLEYDSKKDELRIWSGLGGDDCWYALENVSKIPHEELKILAKHLAPKEEW
jgi:hypothetical protein